MPTVIRTATSPARRLAEHPWRQAMGLGITAAGAFLWLGQLAHGMASA
jgi:hypothetical protein